MAIGCVRLARYCGKIIAYCEERDADENLCNRYIILKGFN